MAITVLTELFYSGVWNNISNDIRVPAGVEVTFGRSDGAGAPEPSRLSLTIDNTGGKYSPRNPTSTLFGLIGRNTPIRISIDGTMCFNGEVSSWPGRWNLRGTDIYMPIEAAGLLRRIGQGNQPASGGLKDYYLSTTPINYWPLDDGSTATSGASAKGVDRGLFNKTDASGVAATFGTGVLADWLPQALRINDMVDVGGPGGPDGFFVGSAIGTSSTPSSLAWEYAFRADPAVSGDGTNPGVLSFEARVTGDSALLDGWNVTIRRGANNDIALSLVDVFASSSTALADTGPLGAVTDGQLHHIRLQLTDNGADVDYAVYLDGTSVITGTKTTWTLRKASSVVVQYDRDGSLGQDLIALGHVICWESANIPLISVTAPAVFGGAGETAGRRIERLCAQEGIGFVAGGNLDDTEKMGFQFEDGFSGQLAECEATDMGLVGESRTDLKLTYIPRTALYGQAPTAVIDYEKGELSAPFEPVDDDQNTRNDVFAQRRNGSSYNATLLTGALSVSPPPSGVGRYKDEYQVNTQGDARLEGVANWRVHLGTLDAARFPSATVNRANPAVTASTNNLSTTIRSVDIGDVIRVLAGPKLNSAAGVYEDLDLLVLGGRLWTDGTEHLLTFNCQPYKLFDVGLYGTPPTGVGNDRYDTTGSELSSGVTTTATSLSVATSATTVAGAKTLWTTDAGAFPFDIYCEGERMTVTTITGASSPQTFTVTRSVNAVVKAHSTGAGVRLWRQSIYAL